jgi:hypothetical protein
MSTTTQGPLEPAHDGHLACEQRPVGVVVLGMSRSGTSAVTGMFAAAGFHVGSEAELMPANPANPRGYFERLDVCRLNDEALSALGGTWFDPPAEDEQRRAEALTRPIDRLLTKLTGQAHGAPLAIKDPRIGVLLPLWREVIAERLHPVLVVRDPVEVASSLARRDGTPIPFALAAWETHISSLLRHLNGRVVTVARYPELLRDQNAPGQIVGAACEHLAAGVVGRVTASRADAVLAPSLVHSRAASGDHEQQLTARQLELWHTLRALPPLNQVIVPPEHLLAGIATARHATQAERDRLSSTTRLAELEAQLVRFEQLHDQRSGELLLERERAQTAEAMVQQLAEARDRLLQSRSWALTAPLRRIATASRSLFAVRPGRGQATADPVRTETGVGLAQHGSVI